MRCRERSCGCFRRRRPLASFGRTSTAPSVTPPWITIAATGNLTGSTPQIEVPLTEPLSATPGVVQRWTPTIEALYVPDIDASLDEQGAKRAFWDAFRAIGDWHQAQPPY